MVPAGKVYRLGEKEVFLKEVSVCLVDCMKMPAALRRPIKQEQLEGDSLLHMDHLTQQEALLSQQEAPDPSAPKEEHEEEEASTGGCTEDDGRWGEPPVCSPMRMMVLGTLYPGQQGAGVEEEMEGSADGSGRLSPGQREAPETPGATADCAEREAVSAGMAAENDIQSLKDYKFSMRSDEDRRAIIQGGRPTPMLTGVNKDGNRNRSFRSSWFNVHKWLAGSARTNKVYCWPCLLLSTRHSIWSFEGYSDWKNLSRSASLHCSSSEHVHNALSLKRLENESMTIDRLLDEQRRVAAVEHNDTVKMNREVLKRLIDITVVLSKQGQAFHGHDGEESLNYRELFEYFFRHDPELKTHWQKNASVFSGLSKSIRNELIECVAEELASAIDKEISDSLFFACEVDEATDVTQHSQLSMVLRYVDNQGRIRERFTGFKDMSAVRNAVALKTLIDRELGKYQYKEKLVAQSYDGAAVMAGELGGLQALVKQDAPQALFVHCFAHRLTLVLQQGAQCIKETRRFFATLEGLSAFFTTSRKRAHLMDETLRRRIPALCVTRWSSHSRVLKVILEEREGLCEVFQEMAEGDGWDNESRRKAEGYWIKLKDQQFLFLALTYCNIFSTMEHLFDVFQRNSTDMHYCKDQIENATRKIGEMRNDGEFQKLLRESDALSSTAPAITRATANASGYQRVFYEILENVILQLSTRFADLEQLQFLQLSDTTRYKAFAERFPDAQLHSLAKSYGKYFDLHKLRNELNVLFSDAQFQSGTVDGVLRLMNETGVCDVLGQAYRLFCLVATIPATMASVERSFSCLKRIKTHLSSTMGATRLSALSLISIEKELLVRLEKSPEWHDKIIQRFDSKKYRQIELQYR